MRPYFWSLHKTSKKYLAALLLNVAKIVNGLFQNLELNFDSSKGQTGLAGGGFVFRSSANIMQLRLSISVRFSLML